MGGYRKNDKGNFFQIHGQIWPSNTSKIKQNANKCNYAEFWYTELISRVIHKVRAECSVWHLVWVNCWPLQGQSEMRADYSLHQICSPGNDKGAGCGFCGYGWHECCWHLIIDSWSDWAITARPISVWTLISMVHWSGLEVREHTCHSDFPYTLILYLQQCLKCPLTSVHSLIRWIQPTAANTPCFWKYRRNSIPLVCDLAWSDLMTYDGITNSSLAKYDITSWDVTSGSRERPSPARVSESVVLSSLGRKLNMKNDDHLRKLWNEILDRQLTELTSWFQVDEEGIMKAAAACHHPPSGTFDAGLLQPPCQHDGVDIGDAEFIQQMNRKVASWQQFALLMEVTNK